MYLTSVTKLKLDKEQFNVIDTMSYRVKALYNSSLYEVNKHFETTGEYLNYGKTDLLMKNHAENTTYKSLPAQISQQSIKKLHKNFSSFFSLLKKKQNNEYDKNIKTPKYLKKDDRKEIIFQKQSFKVKDEWIYISVSKDLSKKQMKLCKMPKNIDDQQIKYMEIVPKLGYYELHIKYEVQEKEVKSGANNWMSIDLGMNNLCTVTSNKTNAFILNGKPIKSINQKYNKKIGKAKSIAKKSNNKHKTKEINRLFTKRGYKLNQEIHKITDFLVQSVLEHDIDFVVIGYNKEWKTGISLGKKTNQNFVQIPFSKILNQLVYKLQLQGIEVHLQEESYTSKTSYFDNEPIKRHRTYKGKRVNRGLFQTGNGLLINADVNGSLNIYRKFISNIQEVHDVLKEPVDTGLVMNPIKIHLKTSTSKDDVLTLIQSL
jgi:putative transposase